MQIFNPNVTSDDRLDVKDRGRAAVQITGTGIQQINDPSIQRQRFADYLRVESQRRGELLKRSLKIDKKAKCNL